MLDGLTPEIAPRLLIAIGGVAVAFLALIAVLIFLKRRNSPLFVKGGRAREHRLLVMDAAAVDAKRRLVLIRRDDTEHLIMIGGPTDIVIETGIGGPNRQKVADEPVVAEKSVAIDEPAKRPRAPQNQEPVQPVRPVERPVQAPVATRPVEPPRVQPAVAKTVSAMGSVLYDDDREPLTGAKTTPIRPIEANPTVTAEAENILDQARARVLNTPIQERVPTPPVQEDVSARNEEAVRALEAQLEASKAEAARAEAANRLEAERAQTARADAARAEAFRAEAARREAARAEAARREAERLEAQRLEAEKAEAERRQQEAQRAEAERAEAARQDAERVEALRLEAEKAEAERAEAERAAAARVEAERIAAARAEAMARFEAARRMQAEQRQMAEPYLEQTSDQPAQLQPSQAESGQVESGQVESGQVEPVQHTQVQPAQIQPAQWPSMELPPVRQEETAELDEVTTSSQERLASDFEKLLEAELEADGVFDDRPAPVVVGERKEQGFGAPAVSLPQPITGATPGVSIEQDMARRLGEISLNKKTDAL